MPLLDDDHVKELLELAAVHGICNECGKRTAEDYCRTCDEFYWIHRKGCLMYEDKHFGHRLTIVPFVETGRMADCDLKHDGPCNPCCNPYDY